MWSKGWLDFAFMMTEDSAYWKDVRFAFNGANDIEYVGVSRVNKADTASGNHWYIRKYTYNGVPDIERIQGPLEGNWDDRAALDW